MTAHNLPPHVQRMEVELETLIDRMTKLNAFVGSETYEGLDTDEKVMLNIQLGGMSTYSLALTQRLVYARAKEASCSAT